MKYSYYIKTIEPSDLGRIDLYSGILLIIETECPIVFSSLFDSDITYTLGNALVESEATIYRYPFIWGVDLGVYVSEP